MAKILIPVSTVCFDTHCFAHLGFDQRYTVTIINNTTEANYTWPLDHQTSIFTCPGAKYLPRQAIRRGFGYSRIKISKTLYIQTS